jgi:hypothetical protein
VEIIETLSHSDVIDRVWKNGLIPFDETVQMVKSRLAGSSDQDGDNLAMPVKDLSIDLADPFSATIFNTPGPRRHLHTYRVLRPGNLAHSGQASRTRYVPTTSTAGAPRPWSPQTRTSGNAPSASRMPDPTASASIFSSSVCVDSWKRRGSFTPSACLWRQMANDDQLLRLVMVEM